jgi:hypothetical protein
LEHPWIKNEDQKTPTLHSVVEIMTQRKMILTGSQQVSKVSDVYPKGDYNEIFDKLVKSGLEPFG